jgi:lipid A 4'-phosphatase
MGIMTAAASRADYQDTNRVNSNLLLLVGGAIAAGVIAGLVFSAFPALDLNTSHFFYRGNGVFSGKGGGIFNAPPTTPSDYIRLALYLVFIAVSLFAAVGLTTALIRKRPAFGLAAPKWLFLALCLAIGPGLVSNIILKDHWGRARPMHLTEFGGSKSYSLPLVPSDQCDHNCSFVSGEASMMYTLFFAAAFLFPWYGRRLILAGVVFGLFSGIIRVSQGAHFLSDVVFAGVVMALTVATIYLALRTITQRTNRNAPRSL